MSNFNSNWSELRKGLEELNNCRKIVGDKFLQLKHLLDDTYWICELIRHLDELNAQAPDLNTPETDELRRLAKQP